MSKRENMIGKIRALRAKTEAAGATEAEAMAAAEMAARLMAEYEVEEADLAHDERRRPDLDIGADRTATDGEMLPPVWQCCYRIQELARVRHLVHPEHGSIPLLDGRGGWKAHLSKDTTRGMRASARTD